VNAADDSPDAVQLAEQVVLHKGYPARQFRTTHRAELLLGIKTPLTPDSE
jgi:hypothetical protein